jgi:hypothetical protein
MRDVLLVFLSLCLLIYAPLAEGAEAREAAGAANPAQEQSQDQYQGQDQAGDQAPYTYENLSPDQMDNLLAPVALYPDPLLAQVLLAATFPDQVDEAARWLREGNRPEDIDTQNWDVSVKAVAHYPTVLNMMDNRLDWTTALGQAYVNQSTDVTEAVQRLRARAHEAGTLVTTPQIEVVEQEGYWCIWPAQPQYIYVPIYSPSIVFFPHPGWHGGAFISFTAGFLIGSWLIYDFDWHARSIFYFGWGRRLSPWAVRARPYIHVTNIYVNDRYRTVHVNRAVVTRRVNYENLDRYHGVHREVTFSRPAAGQAPRSQQRVQPPVNNQVIQRNINSNDERIDRFRGREAQPVGRGPQAQPQVQAQPQAHPAPKAASPPPATPFETHRGTFSPHESSARGQASRQEASRPAVAARPAPASRPSPAARSAPSRSAPPSGGRKP